MFNIMKSEIKYQLKSPLFYIFFFVITLFVYSQFGLERDFDGIKSYVNKDVLDTLPEESKKFGIVKVKVADRIRWDIESGFVYKYPTGFAKKYGMDEGQLEKMRTIYKIAEGANTYEELKDIVDHVDELLEGGGSEYSHDLVQSLKIRVETKEDYLRNWDNFMNKDKIIGGYGRLFSDYISFPFGIFTAFIGAYVIIRDKKNGIFEVIYSKGITPLKYILGKYTATTLLMVVILGGNALFYDIAFLLNPGLKGLDTMIFPCLRYSLIWVIPTIMITNAISMLVATITGSGSISIIVQLILWFRVMNSGLASDFKLDKYIIRFNSSERYELFMENLKAFYTNRIFYVFLSLAVVMLCVMIFEFRRRRMFGGYGIFKKFSRVQS